MLDTDFRMDAREVAEYTRAALREYMARAAFTRIIGKRLDSSNRDRLVNCVLDAMATIKRGPHPSERIGDIVRGDAGETGYLPRDLLYKLRGVKEVKYAQLKGRTLVPISNEVPPGAETHSYEVFDRSGRAKAGSSYEGRAPRADVKVSEVTGKIGVVRLAYGWNVQDLRAAAFSGRSLPVARGLACRAGMEFGIDENLANGIVNTDLKGLINNGDITKYTTDGAGGSTTVTGLTGTWSTATAAQIVADFGLIISAVREATKEVHFQEGTVDVVLTTKAYDRIATLPYSTLNGETVLSVIKRSNPFLRSITSWYRLAAAGISARDRSIWYTRDPMNLEGQIPLDIMQHPPEAEALEFLIEMEARTAGVDVYYPGSAAYVDGV